MSSRHGAGASGLARWAMLQLKGGFQGCGCPRRVPVIPVRVAVPRVGSTKPARLRGSGSFTRPCRRRPRGQQGEGRGKTGPWGPPAGRLRVPICGGRRGRAPHPKHRSGAAPAPGVSGGEEGTGVGEPRFPPAPQWLTQCPFHLLMGGEMLSLAAFFPPTDRDENLPASPRLRPARSPGVCPLEVFCGVLRQHLLTLRATRLQIL